MARSNLQRIGINNIQLFFFVLFVLPAHMILVGSPHDPGGFVVSILLGKRSIRAGIRYSGAFDLELGNILFIAY